MEDEFNLERYVEAQDSGDGYATALMEIRSGRKVSHWIWYVFPQLTGLGTSHASRRYAISSISEARAYLRHPVLGSRLREIGHAALDGHVDDASVLFGFDDVKFRSSMTLFMLAAPDDPLFRNVIEHFFEGKADARTEALLREG